MKKRLVIFMSVFLLAACGTSEEEALPNADETMYVYEGEDTFSHTMEGVELEFDYNIQEVAEKLLEDEMPNAEAGDFLLEINGKIHNDFSQVIYYTPGFTVQAQTPEQVELNQLSSTVENEQIMVNPQMETDFKVVYLIPKHLYYENSSLNLRVPAAFKEPDSESSGDALGDFADWEIPIK